ncbi:MAG: recombination protein RecR [Bdellovibrionales bacterium RBG_16_40_8]|nr:MAG: recombination protein RecR [Bdellovibrionales bacterium RBG_16_40_8]
MILHTPSLDRLINELTKLPGIGSKTAQRLAYHILRSSKHYSKSLRGALEAIEENVHECPRCYSFTENEALCHYCTDINRVNDMLCVVEDPADIARLDYSGSFRGRYHVLHGAISPLAGIAPKDIRLSQLFERIKNENIREVILALDSDLEGDTTVLYIAKHLRGQNLKVSRLAHGIPIGGDIDYIDHRTLGRALENRVEI